jgi:hypothetical protein
MASRWRWSSAAVFVVGMIGTPGCGPSSRSSNDSTPNKVPTGASEDGGIEAGPSVGPNGCPINSGFAGDDTCLAPPPADAGFQLHYGPDSYLDPDAEAPYINAPGVESIDCYYLKTPNTSDVYVGGYDFQMRPGSHHLNAIINSQPQADGFATCGANDNSPGLLGGTQTPSVDERADPAPENQGLAVYLPADSQAVLNFHVINVTSKSLLREAWLNYYYIDPSQVRGFRGNVFLVGGLGFEIAPGTHQTYTYACSPDRPTRILSLAAHMHVHSDRMTAWKVTNGQPTLIYETYDWSSPTELRYDSVHTNQMPDPATQTPGGTSGDLVLQPTDTLQWQCDVNNTSNVTLTFRNEVETGEMCIMTGVMVPADNPMNADNFECQRN